MAEIEKIFKKSDSRKLKSILNIFLLISISDKRMLNMLDIESEIERPMKEIYLLRKKPNDIYITNSKLAIIDIIVVFPAT